MKKSVNRFRIDWDGKCRSKIQFKVKQFLKPYWLSHIVYEEFPVYGSLLKVDILNATLKVAVEVQGKQHGEFNPFFHNDSRVEYLKSIKRDYAKSEWLKKNEFQLVEIFEDEVDNLSKKFFEEKFDLSL